MNTLSERDEITDDMAIPFRMALYNTMNGTIHYYTLRNTKNGIDYFKNTPVVNAIGKNNNDVK